MTLLFGYIVGALITCSFLILRFNTTIVIHILELLGLVEKDTYHTIDDFDKAVDDKYLMADWPKSLIPEWWDCCFCMGIWIGAMVATIITLVGGFGFWFIPGCTISWVFFIWILQKNGAF